MATTALAVWFTGLSGSGKTTLCDATADRLRVSGIKVQILDGDEIRRDLCSDLGFSMQDRYENVRRIAVVSDLLIRNGVIVLVAAISPSGAMRDAVRKKIGSFMEVFVDAPLDICEGRDPKGLYKRARRGELYGFTGIDSPYEPPLSPDITCHTDRESIAESTNKVVSAIWEWNLREGDKEASPESVETEGCRTIAVDFDGLISDYDGWRGRDVLGTPRGDVVQALVELKADGWKIIIHTTRLGVDIIDYLRKSSIPFDEINRDCVCGAGFTKPRATIYWDDRALKYSGDARKDLELIRTFRTWSGRQ